MQQVVKRFQQTNPNITVKISESTDYSTRLQTSLNAGLGPDTFDAPARPQLDVMAKAGQVLDLSSYIGTGKIDDSAWTQYAKDAVTMNGKVYATPGGKYTVGIAYHKELFAKAGIISTPQTWADMGKAFAQLKAINVIPYSIAAGDGSLTYFNYIGLASTVLGLDGFNAVVNGSKKLTDPDLVAVIQQMMDWGPYYQPNYVGTKYQESKSLFATGKAAAMDAGSSDFEGFKAINPTAQFGFFYWPAPDAQHKPCTNTGSSYLIGINAKTKNGDAAATFAGWVASKTGAQAMLDILTTLPTVQGVTVTDPVSKIMVDTPLDVPVWYERSATANIGTVWTNQGQAPFEKKMTADQFAKLLQQSVDQQLAATTKQQ